MSKSKQINFFIIPNDLENINAFFKQNDCIIIKNNVSSVDIAFDYDIVKNKDKNFQVFLSRKEYRGEIKFKYLDSQEYYYVDVLTSSVIEFDIGGFYPYSDKELHRSRFYFIYEYYDQDKLVQKPPEFIEWANNIFREFKKLVLKKSSVYSNDFMTENCINWVEANNAKLESGGQKFIK